MKKSKSSVINVYEYSKLVHEGKNKRVSEDHTE